MSAPAGQRELTEGVVRRAKESIRATLRRRGDERSMLYLGWLEAHWTREDARWA